MTVNYLINQLLSYGLKNQMIYEHDSIYCANKLIDILKVPTFEFEETKEEAINVILEGLCDYAYEHKIIERNDVTTYDLFDTLLMDVIMPRPSEVLRNFEEKFKVNKEDATNYFYDLACKSNYIRMDRIKKNICFKYASDYGLLDITINLSKPEKDPKLIALAKTLPQSGYPKCLLCYENMGYAGNLNHPARQNHRLIPVHIAGEDFYMQYSPYVYYNEHTILLNKVHKPMVIEKATFAKLLDFVSQFEHYFVGSNADLPIVGGSILSHDHYQGGHYTFPMFETKVIKEYVMKGFEDVKVEYLHWPLETIRLSSKNKEDLINLSDKILGVWRNYTSETCGVYAYTDNTPHNTITPIVRNNKGTFQVNLVLRNNRTDEEHPLGIFHPNNALHHIKKENIGLIEVMGLAVLPKRLKEEMDLLKEALLNNNLKALDNEPLLKHKEWTLDLLKRHTFTKENIDKIINDEIGEVFKLVLEDCGVFRMGNKIEEMDKFLEACNK